MTAPSAPEGCTQFCFTTNQQDLAQNIFKNICYLVGLRRSKCLKNPSACGQILRGNIPSMEKEPSVRVHNRKHMELRLYWYSLKVSVWCFFPYHAFNELWGFVRQPRTGLKTWVVMKSEQCNKGAIHLGYTAAWPIVEMFCSLQTCKEDAIDHCVQAASSCVYSACANFIKCPLPSVISQDRSEQIRHHVCGNFAENWTQYDSSAHRIGWIQHTPCARSNRSALQAPIHAQQLSNQLGRSSPAAEWENPYTEMCILNPSMECAKTSYKMNAGRPVNI